MEEVATVTVNPWNLMNKPLTQDIVRKIFSRVGLPGNRQKDISLFQQACVHRSQCRRHNTKQKNYEQTPKPDGCVDLFEGDSEELEFIGDGILGSVMAIQLRERQPNMGEGFYSTLRAKFVNNRTLGGIVVRMGLRSYIVMDQQSEETSSARSNLRVLGSVLEAWIGAVQQYHEGLDGTGDVWAKRFIISVYETYVNFAEVVREDHNQKTQLVKMFVAKYGVPPKFTELRTYGPLHDRVYEVGIEAPDGTIIAEGESRNKKNAEQIASKKAMDIMRESEEDA